MPEVFYPWKRTDKPCINYWYRVKAVEKDFWKFVKDYHSPERNITYYKIIEYYNGDILYSGTTLAGIREIMRENTWKKVV